MNVDNAIRLFAIFLNASWTSTTQLLTERYYTSNEDSVNDWLQANWEILVERKILEIGEYLEVYGEGADFNGASSRITDPTSFPTYMIQVLAKNGSSIYDFLNEEETASISLTFEKLVGFRDGFYVLEPDFNFVLLTDQNMSLERVVRLIDVKFDLVIYDRPHF